MRAAWIASLVLVAGCTRPPRPAVLSELDRTRDAAPAQGARALAPQAFLAAEKLREDAWRADDEGDRAGAQLLAEQALAAYADAAVLARLATADDRLTAAAARVTEMRREVAALEEKQRRVAAEADDIDLKFRVTRDALPVATTEPASADRERSRLDAARALALEARLLCVATQMLGPDTPGVAAAFKALGTLDADLQAKPLQAGPALDSAVRLRSACLSELTNVRRAASSAAPEAGAADALLDELGRAAFEPRRDDRGVVVTLRDAFQGAALTPAARDRVTALGQVGKAHPTFPVLVVAHSARGAATPRDAARAEAVQKALVEAGAARVQAKAGGSALPITPPQRADAAARNERIEIVFVAPAY